MRLRHTTMREECGGRFESSRAAAHGGRNVRCPEVVHRKPEGAAVVADGVRVVEGAWVGETGNWRGATEAIALDRAARGVDFCHPARRIPVGTEEDRELVVGEDRCPFKFPGVD